MGQKLFSVRKYRNLASSEYVSVCECVKRGKRRVIYSHAVLLATLANLKKDQKGRYFSKPKPSLMVLRDYKGHCNSLKLTACDSLAASFGFENSCLVFL